MLSKKPRIEILEAKADEKFHNRRLLRNSCFLGINEKQQKESQRKISNATVGIAGSGGLGSNLAMQLARMGVKHIKIGDPDHFEESNINRQHGAGIDTIGRNKSLVVGEMIQKSMPDVKIEVFPEGIQRHTAEAFVEGTDLLFDCTDFYLVDERYALHRAYRKHTRTKSMLCAMVWGWGCAIYDFDRYGMTFEELIGLPEGEDLTPDKIERLLLMQANYFPRFPNKKYILNWMDDMGNIPILGAVVPIAIGFLAARGCLKLSDMDCEPYCTPLPPIPNYHWVDALELKSSLEYYDGNWRNLDAFIQHFPNG